MENYHGEHEEHEEYFNRNFEEVKKKLLQKVIKSYPHLQLIQGVEERNNYSEAVLRYVEVTTTMLDLIKKQMISSNSYEKELPKDSWKSEWKYVSTFEENLRKFYDCECHIDNILSIWNTKAPSDFNNAKYSINVQVKVVTYQPDRELLLPLTKSCYCPSTGWEKKLELSSLEKLGIYCWIYWCQVEHKIKDVYILRDPKSLYFPIVSGSDIVRKHATFKNEKTNMEKSVLYLDPKSIHFPSQNLLTPKPKPPLH